MQFTWGKRQRKASRQTEGLRWRHSGRFSTCSNILGKLIEGSWEPDGDKDGHIQAEWNSRLSSFLEVLMTPSHLVAAKLNVASIHVQGLGRWTVGS